MRHNNSVLIKESVVRFNWAASRTFDLVWPKTEGFTDPVTFHCEVVDVKAKEMIDNLAVTIAGENREKGTDATAGVLGEGRMTYNMGTVKRLVLENGVKGWDNIADDDGEKTQFTTAKLFAFLARNGDQDAEVHGSCMDYLFDEVGKRSGIFRKTVSAKVDEKN